MLYYYSFPKPNRHYHACLQFTSYQYSKAHSQHLMHAIITGQPHSCMPLLQVSHTHACHYYRSATLMHAIITGQPHSCMPLLQVSHTHACHYYRSATLMHAIITGQPHSCMPCHANPSYTGTVYFQQNISKSIIQLDVLSVELSIDQLNTYATLSL